MDKRQRAKIKEGKNITYQEAWNKISEYMKKDGDCNFFVDNYSTDPSTLYTYSNTTVNGIRITHFMQEEIIGRD